MTLTPTQQALMRIETLLSNQYRNKLSLWELNFLNECLKIAQENNRYRGLSMKQKQMIFNIFKKFVK